MKVVIVIRSVTLRNALSFVRDNLNCTPTHFTNSKLISSWVCAAFGIKQPRKALLHFIVADLPCDKLVYIKLKLSQLKAYDAEFVIIIPYDELSLAIEHLGTFRKENLNERQFPRGWQDVFTGKLLELITEVKMCG